MEGNEEHGSVMEVDHAHQRRAPFQPLQRNATVGVCSSNSDDVTATPAAKAIPTRKQTAPGAPMKRIRAAGCPLEPMEALTEAREPIASASKCRERLGEAAAIASGPSSSSSSSSLGGIAESIAAAVQVTPTVDADEGFQSFAQTATIALHSSNECIAVSDVESGVADGRHVRPERARSGTRKRLDSHLEDARQASEREQFESQQRVGEVAAQLKRLRVSKENSI